MHRVFVYGTLKRGFDNHALLQDARFIGAAYTVARYRLLDGEFPVLRDVGPDRMTISGELYDVDDLTLGLLDDLEGLELGMYDRIEIDIIMRSTLNGSNQASRAYVYIGNAKYWDHQSLKSCVARDSDGHVDWTAKSKRESRRED